MSTVHSPTTKNKAPAKAADEGGAATATGGGVASTRPDERAAGRRIPLTVLALGGAALAVAYGYFALAMRLGPPLVMVGLGGFTLALCAAALWRVIDPLTRDEVALVPETRAPHRLRELDREKQAVLKAIKEIELDYQMRKISEVDYREMVERYRARALRVMGDLAAGDDYRALIERELKHRLAARVAAGGGSAVSSGESAKPATTSSTGGETPVAAERLSPRMAPSPCAGCGTSNDSDAQFCKTCGLKMHRSVEREPG